MKCIVFISLFYSLLVAENEYCSISDITENPSILSRQYYNIGDTISEEDQTFCKYSIGLGTAAGLSWIWKYGSERLTVFWSCVGLLTFENNRLIRSWMEIGNRQFSRACWCRLTTRERLGIIKILRVSTGISLLFCNPLNINNWYE